jgi:hypothetical protein
MCGSLGKTYPTSRRISGAAHEARKEVCTGTDERDSLVRPREADESRVARPKTMGQRGEDMVEGVEVVRGRGGRRSG